MRLNSKDAEKLFNSVDVGMQGEIIYEPVKIGTHGGNIFIEVHEDIYRKRSDLYKLTVSKLKKSNLYSQVDMETVKKAVEEKEGIPIVISKTKRPYYQHTHQNFSVKNSSGTQLWNELAVD